MSAAKTYAPGFFSAPVAAWKSMRFESQIVGQIDKTTKKFKSDWQRAEALRKNSGFDSVDIGLPGSMPYRRAA